MEFLTKITNAFSKAKDIVATYVAEKRAFFATASRSTTVTDLVLYAVFFVLGAIAA